MGFHNSIFSGIAKILTRLSIKIKKIEVTEKVFRELAGKFCGRRSTVSRVPTRLDYYQISPTSEPTSNESTTIPSDVTMITFAFFSLLLVNTNIFTINQIWSEA
jgi:hypothetical protein